MHATAIAIPAPIPRFGCGPQEILAGGCMAGLLGATLADWRAVPLLAYFLVTVVAVPVGMTVAARLR